MVSYVKRRTQAEGALEQGTERVERVVKWGGVRPRRRNDGASKTKAIGSFETSVTIYQSTQRHILEALNHQKESLRSGIKPAVQLHSLRQCSFTIWDYFVVLCCVFCFVSLALRIPHRPFSLHFVLRHLTFRTDTVQ